MSNTQDGEAATQLVTYNDLMQMTERDEAFVLLNVLSADEFRNAYIPGSINVHHEHAGFAQKVAETIRMMEYAKGRVIAKIVLYGAGPECNAATKAAKKLQRAGFTDVAVYRGGMEEWRANAYYLQSGRPKK